MSRVAVLGSNSFAGAAFVDASLAVGYEVLGINRSAEPSAIFLPHKSNPRASAYRFRQLDLNRHFDEICAVMSEFEPQFVVDFAGQGMVAESWQRPEQWYQTNIVSKVKLHDWLRTKPWLSKYVRVSTPEVYGSTGHLVSEKQAYSPSTPYAVSHAATDMSLFAFFRNYDFPVVLTRFANFYGPGQQLYRIVPRTIIYALAGRKLPLHGGGTSVRAFIHARDVAHGLLLVLAKAVPGETYHFSPTDFHSIRKVVEIICAELEIPFYQVAEVAAERAGKDQAYLMDASKAKEQLDWRPQYSFLEGIRGTIGWIKCHLEEIRGLPWDYAHKA